MKGKKSSSSLNALCPKLGLQTLPVLPRIQSETYTSLWIIQCIPPFILTDFFLHGHLICSQSCHLRHTKWLSYLSVFADKEQISNKVL